MEPENNAPQRRRAMRDAESLAELYRQAVTFPGPTILLAGLRTALDAVEEELAHARDQAAIRLRARHAREAKVFHPDDRELDMYELEVTRDQILPRVFRGGFVLTLWSVFEVVVKRMASYASRERGFTAEHSEFKQGNFLKALENIYARDLGIVAFPDAVVRNELDQLREIRNALIHHNGSVAALPQTMRSSVTANYLSVGLQTHADDLNGQAFIPTAEFLRRNLALVDSYLTSLSAKVYEAVHPTPLKDEET